MQRLHTREDNAYISFQIPKTIYDHLQQKARGHGHTIATELMIYTARSIESNTDHPHHEPFITHILEALYLEDIGA